MTWIQNDEVLDWEGVKVLNMTAIQQVKGKRGEHANIVNPEVAFPELYRHTVGVDFEELIKATNEPEHTQIVNLSNAEEGLPDGPINDGQRLAVEATIADTGRYSAGVTPATAVQTQPGRSKQTNRAKRPKERRRKNNQLDIADDGIAKIASSETTARKTRK